MAKWKQRIIAGLTLNVVLVIVSDPHEAHRPPPIVAPVASETLARAAR